MNPGSVRELAEAVIGACLLDENIIPDVRALLPTSAFDEWPDLKLTYIAICELNDKQALVDMATVANHIATNHKAHVEKARWNPGVMGQWTCQIFNPLSAPHYAKTVRGHYLLRRTMEFCRQLHGAIKASEITSADEAIERVIGFGQKLSDWWARGIKTFDLGDSVQSVISRLEADEQDNNYLPSGFVGLDELTGGLQQGAMIVIGARPSVGKTALGISMAVHACRYEMAKRSGKKIVFASLEMTQQMIVERMISYMGVIPLHMIVRPQSINGARPLVIERAKEIGSMVANMPIEIVEAGAGSRIQSLEGAVQRIASKNPISLIVVDYVQLINASRRESKVQEVSEVTRRLKLMAMTLNCPVVALSQLNRNIEHAASKRLPTLADLRDSGSIEQDADIVLFPVREESEPGDITEEAIIYVAKHRNGPTGHFECRFVKPIASYVNTQDAHEIERRVNAWAITKNQSRGKKEAVRAVAEGDMISW